MDFFFGVWFLPAGVQIKYQKATCKFFLLTIEYDKNKSSYRQAHHKDSDTIGPIV